MDVESYLSHPVPHDIRCMQLCVIKTLFDAGGGVAIAAGSSGRSSSLREINRDSCMACMTGMLLGLYLAAQC